MRSLAAIVFAALALSACGGEGEPATSPAPTETSSDRTAADASVPTVGEMVTIERSRFEPATVEVSAGATVTFTNLDPFAHTVTGKDGAESLIDSDNLTEDDSYEVTFDEAGTYDYYCKIHPTMRASVVVS